LNQRKQPENWKTDRLSLVAGSSLFPPGEGRAGTLFLITLLMAEFFDGGTQPAFVLAE